MSTATDEETQTQDDTPQVPVEGGDNDDETPPGMTPDGEPGPADDDVQEDEQEFIPPPPTIPPVSEKDMEKKIGQMERAAATYKRKIDELLGDESDLYVETPLTDPVPFGFILHPRFRPIPEEVVNLTKAVIGEPIPPPLVQDPRAHECPTCQGWGQVLTGSKVHGKNTARCEECKGRGWVGERANVTPEQVAAGITPESLDVDGEPVALLSEDNWGTPLGHPDYGKMPQYREPGWAEALEAYKRGEAAPVA